MEFEDYRTIDLVYYTNGTKLRTIKRNGSQTVEDRVYAGGLQYVNGRLESVAHAEGRTFYEGDNSRIEYNLTDHLSNVRAVFSDLNGNGQVDLSVEADRSELLVEFKIVDVVAKRPGSDYSKKRSKAATRKALKQ